MSILRYTGRMQTDPLLYGSTTELTQGVVPEIDFEAFMPLIMTSLAITAVLTVLFFVYIIFTSIRHYKVEKATIEMQKDIRRMRELMEQGSTPTTPPQVPPKHTDLLATTPATTDSREDRVLARIESESTRGA